jgi:hypothetical protein
MSKLLLLLSLFALAILGIGTATMPNDPMFWLASSANHIQYVRTILAGMLMLQLITNPPRSIRLRVLTGTIAAIVGVWTIQQTLNGNLQFLDILAFLSTSLAVFITALERSFTSIVTYSMSEDNKTSA